MDGDGKIEDSTKKRFDLITKKRFDLITDGSTIHQIAFYRAVSAEKTAGIDDRLCAGKRPVNNQSACRHVGSGRRIQPGINDPGPRSLFCQGTSVCNRSGYSLADRLHARAIQDEIAPGIRSQVQVAGDFAADKQLRSVNRGIERDASINDPTVDECARTTGYGDRSSHLFRISHRRRVGHFAATGEKDGVPIQIGKLTAGFIYCIPGTDFSKRRQP